jgi:CRP-like cAMP-binding protein
MAGMHKRGLGRRGKSQREEIFFYRRSDLPNPPSDNLILASVPRQEFERLRPYLEFVPLRSGTVLWETNTPIESVYFPTSGMVSLTVVLKDGATPEVGMVGREAFLGTPVVLGARSAPIRAIVQIEGHAFRTESNLLRQMLPQTPRLEERLHGYANAYAMLAAQLAACNSRHQVLERLSRWLAMSHDRVRSDLLPITQEFVAQMLGCRRSSITTAVSSLQKAGVIRPAHGGIRILDRRELERIACECYGVMRRLYDVRIG